MREIKPESTIEEVQEFVSLDEVAATCQEMGATKSPEQYLDGLRRFTKAKLEAMNKQEGGIIEFIRKTITWGNAMQKEETSAEQPA